MHDLQHYLNAPYADQGTGPDAYNCWTMVREILHDWYRRPWLPAHLDVCPDDDQEKSLRYNEVLTHFSEVSPCAGSVVAMYKLKMLWHVGIGINVDGRLRVLHTRRGVGTKISRPAALEMTCTRMRWWGYV